MFFRSFAAYRHVFALALALLLLLSLPDAASGAPQNVTIRFDSTQVPVSFTSGWRVAEFTGTGTVDKFAFANNPGEQLIVKLPQNVSALSYQGFKTKGGAQYFVCLDCDADTNPNSFIVDAHDGSDNGTQPPVTLFHVPEVDPTQTHVLRVINLEDDRFNDTSQITFDSLVLTLADEPPVSSSAPAGTSTSTTSVGATSSIPAGGNPTATVVVSPTDGSASASTVASTTMKTQTPSVSASQSVPIGVATTGASSGNSQGPTASVSSSGGGASQTQSSSGSSATSTGSQTQTQTGSSVVSSAAASGGSQPISTPGSGPGSASSSGSSSVPGTSSSAVPDNEPTNGVSKTVIIVVAVIASLFVLALLSAITWLLVRNQPPPRGDVEGTAGLMRQAAPAAGIIVSGPLPLSPMRPEIPNPFVDPLDDLSPPPRPAPPPPVPPRSPLRATNFPSDRPAWLTRTPRTPSPESSNE